LQFRWIGVAFKAVRVVFSIFVFLIVSIAADYVATGGFYTAGAAVLVSRKLDDLLN
jgi:hypothetical protein